MDVLDIPPGPIMTDYFDLVVASHVQTMRLLHGCVGCHLKRSSLRLRKYSSSPKPLDQFLRWPKSQRFPGLGHSFA